MRRFHLTKSNKWDAPKDILLVSKRQQVTASQERKHREYNKTNEEYWSNVIHETRSKRRKLLASQNNSNEDKENTPHGSDVERLTVTEIKAKLKELGVSTLVRKLEKLQQILRRAEQSIHDQV